MPACRDELSCSWLPFSPLVPGYQSSLVRKCLSKFLLLRMTLGQVLWLQTTAGPLCTSTPPRALEKLSPDSLIRTSNNSQNESTLSPSSYIFSTEPQSFLLSFSVPLIFTQPCRQAERTTSKDNLGEFPPRTEASPPGPGLCHDAQLLCSSRLTLPFPHHTRIPSAATSPTNLIRATHVLIPSK